MRLCQYTGQRFSTRSNWDWWGKSEILCSRYWRTRIVSLTLTQQWVRVSSVDFMLCGKGSQGSNGEFGATSKNIENRAMCVCVSDNARFDQVVLRDGSQELQEVNRYSSNRHREPASSRCHCLLGHVRWSGQIQSEQRRYFTHRHSLCCLQ